MLKVRYKLRQLLWNKWNSSFCGRIMTSGNKTNWKYIAISKVFVILGWMVILYMINKNIKYKRKHKSERNENEK